MNYGTNGPYRLACAIVGAACAMLSWASPANEDVAGKPVFTDDEIRIILSHGPWPAPAARDPTNRVSGKPDAIEFGDAPVLRSAPLRQRARCRAASCHVPERNWTDNLARGVGMAEVNRNTPTGDESARQPLVRLGRRCRQPVVAEPAPAPGRSANWRRRRATWRNWCAMTNSCRAVTARRSAPRRRPPTTKRCSSTSAKRSPRFQETLVSGRTPFDQFRDALARGRAAVVVDVIQSRRSAGSRFSSARAAAPTATPAPISPTASSSAPACRALRRAASPIPDATTASASSWRAASICSVPTTTTRRAASAAHTRAGRARSSKGEISASSRCRRCATWC